MNRPDRKVINQMKNWKYQEQIIENLACYPCVAIKIYFISFRNTRWVIPYKLLTNSHKSTLDLVINTELLVSEQITKWQKPLRHACNCCLSIHKTTETQLIKPFTTHTAIIDQSQRFQTWWFIAIDVHSFFTAHRTRVKAWKIGSGRIQYQPALMSPNETRFRGRAFVKITALNSSRHMMGKYKRFTEGHTTTKTSSRIWVKLDN